MQLIDVYSEKDAPRLLWGLLLDRRPEQNISHKEMPSWEEHCRFIDSDPYDEWYLIVEKAAYVGAVYLTDRNEIGVHVFKEYSRRGYEIEAINLLMRAHPRKQFLANVGPEDTKLASTLNILEFKHIQNTYCLKP